MKAVIPPPYVSMISYAIFIDHVYDETLVEQLKNLGFNNRSDTVDCYRMNPAPQNRSDLAKIISILRDMGLPFSAGKEWCPSEVAVHLRQEGYITGEIKEIAWLSPGNFIIRDL